MRIRLLAVTFLALALVPLARADGLPIADVSAPTVLQSSEGQGRYVAVPAGRGTVVARIGGVVYASAFLDRRYTIPVVALDGTAAGLSTDGSTLVLIDPRRTFPRARTSLVVLDAKSLRTLRRIDLDGDFSFDALSPDGTRMFLIHYLSRKDPTRYEVRGLDVPSGKLLPTPIVDKSEPDERMAGFPITRETTADGRWAYTLYDGAGHEPFVHALDAVDGEAHCIDLEVLAGRQDLYDLRLTVGGGAGGLAVVSGTETVTLLDTGTFEPVARNAAGAIRAESSSFHWPYAVLAASGGAALVLLVALKRRSPTNGARGRRPGRERKSSLRA